MISYKDPVVELVPNPVALDMAIQTVQQKLAGLAWLQKAFGRATRQTSPAPLYSKEYNVNLQQAKGDITFPEVYNNREPMPLMINDNLKSYCFFHLTGPMAFQAWESFATSQIATQPLSVIFWLNLEKIDNTKKFNFSEILRRDVVNILNYCPDFQVRESDSDITRVFAPYTITSTFKQFLKPPYAAFRINGEISFDYLSC
jgi:hypothetical protein